MLTADLIVARRYRTEVRPRWLDPDDEEALERAHALVAAFDGTVGGARGQLDDIIEDLIGHGTDFLVWRGLAKLVDDRATWETVAAVDPPVVRKAMFEANFAAGPPDDDRVRTTVDAVAAELGLQPAECREAMYADLDSRQVLTQFESIEPRALLLRYNVALAQGVLYRASKMTVRLRQPEPNELRYVMSALKFHGLMHLTTHDADDVLLQIDGPSSLFKMSRKYGLAMATFLPVLLHVARWELEADVDWKGKNSKLKLSDADGLVSHYKARGQWISEEERWFEEKFATLDTEWRLERRGHVVKLVEGEVLATDYVLTAPDGREVYVEIVGFWRAAYLKRRIDALAAVRVPLVIVASERLKTDRDKLENVPAQVFFFKGVILASRVLECAQAALDHAAARG